MKPLQLKKGMGVLLFLSVIFVLTGCCSPNGSGTGGTGGTGTGGTTGAESPPQPGDIARILAVSGNVTVGDVKVPDRRGAAREGMYLYSGDKVTTGSGGTVTIGLKGGALLDLDENTDPLLEWMAKSACYVISMFYGDAIVDTGKTCMEILAGDATIKAGSRIYIRVDRAKSITSFKVLDGQAVVALKQRPSEKTTVLAGQSTTITKARVASPQKIPPAELRDLQTRFKNIRIAPSQPPAKPGSLRILQ